MAAWRRTSSLSFSKRCSSDSFMNTCRIKVVGYQKVVSCNEQRRVMDLEEVLQ